MISNGVINLAPDKAAVFAEAARVLKPGGRLAIADIVSEQQMKESIVCDADLWASCIGGAAQQDAYREAIEGAGLRIEQIRENPYEFISDRARDASAKYGVKSVSLLAEKLSPRGPGAAIAQPSTAVTNSANTSSGRASGSAARSKARPLREAAIAVARTGAGKRSLKPWRLATRSRVSARASRLATVIAERARFPRISPAR